jgi:archaellum component FlaC
MATRMQQRRGTALQWNSADPILEAGEIGFESDTNKFKMGDGVNQWSDLDYFINESAISTDIEGAISDTEKGANNGVATLDAFGRVPIEQLGNLVDGAPNALNTLNEIAAALNDDENFANAVISQLDNVNATVDTHTNSLITITGNISTINNNINSITSTVGTNSNNISTLQTDMDSLETTVSYLSGNTVANLTAHADATANVHGIANTADLATKSFATAAASNAIANASAYADGLAGNYEASGAVSTHSADTTSVHGIADTTKIALLNANTQTFTGSIEVDGNFTVDGNFIVNGSNVLVSATQLQIEDSLLQLAHENAANTVDLGIVVGYNDGGTAYHAGFVRDVSENEWKLFRGVTTEPSTTVDFTQGTLDNLEMANLIAAGITASSATIGGVAFSDKANSTATIADMNGSHTATSADVDNIREMSGGGTLSIPSDNAFWPIGRRMEVIQTGSGEVTIEGASGVTVNGTPGLKLRAQWSGATIIKRANNVFVAIGDLKA